MNFWHLLFLVLMLGITVVTPVIALVVAVRGLGSHTLSEKQRQAREKELREAGIVRDGEEWERHDLDELLLNMRRYDQWWIIGSAATLLLAGGVGMGALIAATGGLGLLVNSYSYSSVCMTDALGIVAGSVMLGTGVGYYTSDRRFAARAGAPPMPHADAIFAGADGAMRRPWWLRALNAGLTVGVSVYTLLYALGKGDTLQDATTQLALSRHPWLIWCVPVALWILLAVQEFLGGWGVRRPPLRLSEQPELAGRADLHRRREAYKEAYKKLNESIPFVFLLAVFQLSDFVRHDLLTIQSSLLIVAFGALIANAFVSIWAGSRRRQRGLGAGEAGLRGGA